MEHPTPHQHYHAVLADIAMAAAIAAHDHSFVYDAEGDDYVAGRIHDRWIARTQDAGLRQKVTAMASAAAASLQRLTAPQLAQAAATYGIALEPGEAERLVEHFSDRRNAVLTYRR
ncbi:MAG: hypothetical protein P4M00_20300 [Azospirillaceae bacterium]|nr:hypothetical protein [Azospirillaceae bacterium]